MIKKDDIEPSESAKDNAEDDNAIVHGTLRPGYTMYKAMAEYAFALLREAADYEAEAFLMGHEVNGADLVEWFSAWRQKLNNLQAPAMPEPATVSLSDFLKPHTLLDVMKAYAIHHPEDIATPELLERARDQYAHGSDDDIEVDEGAAISESTSGGTWVQAWVFVRPIDPEE